MTAPDDFGSFFLPGPTEVRPAVLAAMLRPMMSHRGSEFAALFANTQRGLRHVFGTARPVFIATCSATGLMEAAVRCAPPGRVLALVNGAFSARFASIAAACGREVQRYEVPWGQIHDPFEVGRHLATSGAAVVTVVHSETSTGALNDVHAINRAAQERGATCVVDSVSGIGGAELRFDAWGLDYVLTGSQKALALPPGLAFAVASERYMASARAAAASGRGVYFDLVEFEHFAARNQAPNTPALSLYYALETQLRDIEAEGIEQRWARHAAMRDATAAWVEAMRGRGLAIGRLAPAAHGSPTVTTVTLPGGLDCGRLVAAVRARGVTIGAGYGEQKATSIRIGHMGDHTLATLSRCLDACTGALCEAMPAGSV